MDAADAEAPPDMQWRTSNVGALLFAATDRCVARKLAVLAAHGHGGITDAQLVLFLHADVEGTRLTTLAERARLTKSSMAELIDRSVTAGYVERIADPDDRRAKRITFTEAGRHALDALQKGIATVEDEVGTAVGADFLARTRVEMGGYAQLAGSGPNVGRLLALSARRFADEVLRGLHARGRTQIGAGLLTLLRVLDLGGTRLTDLAGRARMTKQSMRELVDRAETSGLVARHADPDDRRAKLIAFTDAGRRVLDQARASIAEAEARLAAQCSDDFLAELKARLTRFCA